MQSKKKWLILVIIFFVGLFGIIMLLNSRPNVGKVIVKNNVASVTVKPLLQKYEDDQIKFEYRGSYGLSHEGERYKILGESGSSMMMVITLKQSSVDLSDVSGVQMRRIKTEDYSESDVDLGNLMGIKFTKKDGKELTSFFEKGGSVLTVALTTNSNDPKYESEYQAFLDNFEWK